MKLNALIAKEIVVRGDKAEQKASVLIDTGASQSFILRKIAELVGTIVKLPKAMMFTLADGRRVTITDGITLALDFAGEAIIDTFLIMETGVEEVILGESTMRKHGMKIDLEHGTVYAAMRECFSNLQQTQTIFHTQEETPMNKVIARLRELFNLAQDASEDVVLAALNAYHDNSAKAGTVLGSFASAVGLQVGAKAEEIEPKIAVAKDALAVHGEVIATFELKPEATVDQIKAVLATAKSNTGELTKLTARVLQLETSTFDNEFNAVIDQAFKEGKILPTQKSDGKWLGLQRNAAKPSIAEFKEYWSKQPVIGPVQKIPESNQSARAMGVTETDLAVAKQLGVTETDLKKYNPAVN